MRIIRGRREERGTPQATVASDRHSTISRSSVLCNTQRKDSVEPSSDDFQLRFRDVHPTILT